MAPIIIDTEVKLMALLAHITECVRVEEDQLLFIDLEGVNLGRLGTVAILQLLMPPTKAFEVATDENTTLKSVLESKTIFKVFFDVRNDSDALHAHFGVNIAGTIDLQIIEYATRQPRGRFVNGLARCIERNLPYSSDWSLIKAKGRRLFAPEVGGKYEVFLERPLPADIVKYCEQDVILMPRLLASYGPKLRSGVAAQIQTIVDERLRLSKTTMFNGQGKHMAVGPCLAVAGNHANLPTSPEVGLVCSARLGLLCRLDDSLIEHLSGQFNGLQVEQDPPTVSDSGTSESNWNSSENEQSTSSANTSLAVPAAVTSAAPTYGFDEDEWGGSFQDRSLSWRTGYTDTNHDSDYERDFTACSADDCGYCGKCDY